MLRSILTFILSLCIAMPAIEVSLKIKKPKEEVYKIIKKMEDFPTFMRDVKNLTVIKRMDDRIVTAWETEIDDAPVSWKEEDYFDDAAFQLKFNMLEGSYKEYQGYWLLEDIHNGTKLTIKANFDWGIPILEKYVGKSLETKARRGIIGLGLEGGSDFRNPIGDLALLLN